MSTVSNSNTVASLSALAVPTGMSGHPLLREVWTDLASHFTPTNMQDAFRLCEFLYLNYPTYRKGSERIVDYFLTSVDLAGGDEQERKTFKKVLNDDFRIMSVLREVGLNFMCYGNAVCSPSFPFMRNVKCRACSSVTNLSKLRGVKLKMDQATGDFILVCRKCKRTGKHQVIDYKKLDPKGIKLINWDPKRIFIEHNPITFDANYWYDIPEFVKSEALGGNDFFLTTLPKPFLDAIRTNKKILFNESQIYHMKEPRIAGVDLRGWGVPSILTAFRNFFRLQVLMRQDEKLMLDYITPMRMLSPKSGGGAGGNAIVDASMRNWMDNMGDMITRHRMDGANWNMVPFAVDYQAIGGEGQQLAPKDLIEMEEDRLLNARGVPPEFYRASMTIQAAPVALRLMERCWSSLVSGQNEITQWLSDSISSYLNGGKFEAGLSSVTIVDDIDNKVWRLQAMASELLSKETALAPMQIDAKEEYDKLLAQQKYEAQKTEEAQRDMEMASISLDSGEGGEGGEGSGQAGGQTPGDINSQADQIARELVMLPEGDRQRQLASYRQTNDTLHALIIKKMDQLRSSARSMGQDQAMEAAVQAPLPGQEGQAG